MTLAPAISPTRSTRAELFGYAHGASVIFRWSICFGHRPRTLNGLQRRTIMKPPKQSKCREKAEGCHVSYVKRSSFQATCPNPLCGLKKAKRDREKKEAKDRAKRAADTRKARDKAKPRAKWLAEAQEAFNRFIRARDKDKPCVSCGRHHQGQYHAGHFLSRAARPDLRFCEDQVHKQCSACNNHLSGNLVNYRQALVAMLGVARVEEIETGPRGRSDWSIDEIKGIKRRYATMAKELEEAHCTRCR